MSQIETRDTVVEFDEKGVSIKEIVQPKLSDDEDDRKVMVREEYRWDEFPKDEVCMEVIGVEKSETPEGLLESLEFRVNEIRKTQDVQPDKSSTDDFWKQVENELGIKYKNGDVELNPNKNGKQNLCDFIVFLLEEDYMSKEDLPKKAENMQERYIANTEKMHTSKEMINPEEVMDGVYVETNNPTNYKEKFIEALGEEYGT
jgi:hypothetical protein